MSVIRAGAWREVAPVGLLRLPVPSADGPLAFRRGLAAWRPAPVVTAGGRLLPRGVPLALGAGILRGVPLAPLPQFADGPGGSGAVGVPPGAVAGAPVVVPGPPVAVAGAPVAVAEPGAVVEAPVAVAGTPVAMAAPGAVPVSAPVCLPVAGVVVPGVVPVPPPVAKVVVSGEPPAVEGPGGVTEPLRPRHRPGPRPRPRSEESASGSTPAPGTRLGDVERPREAGAVGEGSMSGYVRVGEEAGPVPRPGPGEERRKQVATPPRSPAAGYGPRSGMRGAADAPVRPPGLAETSPPGTAPYGRTEARDPSAPMSPAPPGTESPNGRERPAHGVASPSPSAGLPPKPPDSKEPAVQRTVIRPGPPGITPAPPGQGAPPPTAARFHVGHPISRVPDTAMPFACPPPTPSAPAAPPGEAVEGTRAPAPRPPAAPPAPPPPDASAVAREVALRHAALLADAVLPALEQGRRTRRVRPRPQWPPRAEPPPDGGAWGSTVPR
ncbi:hypothetical protein GCM10010214_56680 [Streptomyces abikoensis]|nr:hypothetical protein GCM10010214_56680 [Streptomyces abikoensis]